ncbi:MAG: hypothetical protein ACTIJ4_01755 [Halomonas sp.]|uniref:hypothetical protein n=1 Tax=Halomonas sp. TaxID=1486246 RepID=UPI003F9538C8
MSEYTQGVCHEGAAILKDGQPLTIEQILEKLRERDALKAHAIAVAAAVGYDENSAYQFNASMQVHCINNVNGFAEHLHAIEREFFMVPGEPDEDYPDAEPDDECLVNCWGSTTEQYVEQFRTALTRRDALKQAEALERCAGQIMHDESREWMRCASKKLRKKAEGHQ